MCGPLASSAPAHWLVYSLRARALCLALEVIVAERTPSFCAFCHKCSVSLRLAHSSEKGFALLCLCSSGYGPLAPTSALGCGGANRMAPGCDMMLAGVAGRRPGLVTLCSTWAWARPYSVTGLPFVCRFRSIRVVFRKRRAGGSGRHHGLHGGLSGLPGPACQGDAALTSGR